MFCSALLRLLLTQCPLMVLHLQERYYKEKLEVPDASPQSTRGVVGHYIKGLHWVLEYYYRGVASWDWFYPYHYAPMASDMRTLDGIEGKPGYRGHLSVQYRCGCCDEASSILGLYVFGMVWAVETDFSFEHGV